MASALTAAYQGELKRTRNAVADRVAANWRRLPDYREKRIPGFLAANLPIVKAGQSRAVALTSAYLSRKLDAPPVGLDIEELIGANIRNGADPDQVYRRPFVTVWAAIATIGFELAVEKGLSRLTSTAAMDIALSGRQANLAYGRESGGEIVGWTRVADPGCCDFCLSIDGARTGPNEPQPLHNRCGCTADPITGSSFGSGDLQSVGDVVGDGNDPAVINDHGELGPVIGAEGDNFAGPGDLNNPDYIES